MHVGYLGPAGTYSEEAALRRPSCTRLAYRRAWSRWWIEDRTIPEAEESSSAMDVDWRPDISL